MRSSKSCLAVLATALLTLSAFSAIAQVQVQYHCRPPCTGTHCVQYRWYLCWPDSNTLTLAATTSDTNATIMHTNTGERVRVQAVDSQSRAGPRSVASEPWQGRSPTGVPDMAAFKLLPNYPNPFNPATTISFELPTPMRVRLDVYGLSGRLLRTLLNADLPAGAGSVVWDGTNDKGQTVASGTYLCRLTAGGQTQTVRMLLVK